MVWERVDPVIPGARCWCIRWADSGTVGGGELETVIRKRLPLCKMAIRVEYQMADPKRGDQARAARWRSPWNNCLNLPSW
jgi:hypothetical protein